MADSGGLTPLVRFIREDDAHEDAFGAHTRLADAICDALEADPTLEVIGLFGAWGSGKSRVVKMLEARMASDTLRFFTYDAWVHQSDAPRRAFLEALIRHLEKHELADATQLQEALAKLLKKTETVEVESRPQVSIGFGLVLAMLLVAPIAGQFLRADWMRPLKGGWEVYAFGLPFSPYFVAAFWIALAPFLALVGISSYRAIQSLRGKQVGGGLTALFANKAKEVRRDLKRTDPEPTALEFQKFFRDLLELVRQSGDRRLVFVVDNLDRLPDQELMALWSSIRGLFHGEAQVGGQRSPTLLLPLDFTAVQRLYDKKEGVAQGFADKTFDLVFRVPAPVNSLWQRYLRDRMEYVFGANARPDWMDVAARILEDGDVDSRLPRAINIYVNELATLWLQWRREDVSFAAIAYYAARRGDLETQPWRMLQQPIPWMAEFDPRWTRGVAAIHYGAAPEVASQILIEEPLRDAITKFDRSAFLELGRLEGFGTVLRRTVEAYRTGGSSLSVTNAALLMAELDAMYDSNVRLAWACVADGVRSDGWEPASELDIKALSLILKHNAAPARARVRAGLGDKLQHRHETEIAAASGSIAAALRLAAHSAEEDNERYEPISLPASAKAAIVMAQDLGKDASLATIVVPDAKLGSELVAYRVAQMKPSRPVVDALVVWRPDFVWSSVYSAAISAVREGNTEAAIRVAELFGEIWRADPGARAALSSTLGSEVFLQRLVSLVDNRDAIGVALVSAVLLLPEEPEPRLGGMWRTLGPDDDLIGRIDHWLIAFAPDLSIDDLLARAARQSEVLSLVRAIVRRRVSLDPDAVSPKGAVKQLDRYLELLPPSVEPIFWQAIMCSPDFWRGLEKRPYAESDFQVAHSMAAVAEGRWAQQAHGFLVSRLSAASSADWRAALERGGPLFDQLAALPAGGSPLSGNSIAEALTISSATLVAKADTPLQTRWLEVVGRLGPTAQKHAYRALAGQMLEARAQRPARLLRTMGRALLKALRSLNRPELVLRKIVLPALQRPTDAIWLGQHATAIAAIVGAAPKGAITEALGEIDRRMALGQASPEHRLALKQLSGALASGR
jgi:KAP family P-loop domain